MKILVTGSAGFICGYLVEDLLNNGYTVYGVDNFSKYGKVKKSYDEHKNYHFFEADAKNTSLLMELAEDCEQIVAAAAMIGGISYFHEMAYDLLAENERIIASTFDAAIHAFKNHNLKKINVLSSSMVFESVNLYPTPEGAEKRFPPPESTYGFQKLACEYFAQGAWEQYQLPYTIIRPFNCVGTGEKKALYGRKISSGNLELALSHVVPDLIQKIAKGQDPLHILGSGEQVRHYTYGADLARGIRLCIEKPEAINQDFNLSTKESTTVLQLAEMIWNLIHKGSKKFSYVSDTAYKYDVQKRIPDVSKAESLLGFRADTPLEIVLEEVIDWVIEQIKVGGI